jgi:cysteine desulfurase
VAGIAGFAAALEAATARLDSESSVARRLTDRVIAWATVADGVEVLGDPIDRLPHLVCLGLDGVEPQPVLLGLDAAGVSVHSGSSCSSESIEPSPVLQAMGVDAERSLRVSVGWSSTNDDIDRLLDVLPKVLSDLRSLRRA